MTAKLRLVKGRHRCRHCVFRKFFVGAGLDCPSIDVMGDSVTQTLGPFEAGETIYRAGDPCDSMYVVQSGSVKIEISTEAGDVHVSGFFLTGEMFGSDGISERVFPSEAIALERTTVCSLPLSNWQNLCELYPALQCELVDELAHIVHNKDKEVLLLHHLKVEARVLIFLKNLLARVRTRLGQGVCQIPLSMSKTDIARYLCTTPETLSRCLSNLERAGAIQNHGKSIEILEDSWPGVESRA